MLVAVSSPRFDELEVRTLIDGFERYFGRGERYALVWAPARNLALPGLRERQQIGEWIRHPRVAAFTKQLCVGTAAVVPNAIARGSLSAILFIGKPPVPLRPVATVADGVDFALERLAASNVRLPKPADLLRFEVLRELKAAGLIA